MSSIASSKFKSSVMTLNCSENNLDLTNEVSGYIGNLTDDETSNLAKFWLLILDILSSSQAFLQHSFLTDLFKKLSIVEVKKDTNDITIEELKKEFWLACHGLSPDAFLLRFLRARKFVIKDAFFMLFQTLHWRLTYNVQSVIEKGETQLDAGQFEGKTFLYKYDQFQRPVLYINSKLHLRNAHSQDQLECFTVYMIETARLFLLDPQSKVTIVFNLEGFSMQNMDYPVLKFLINVLQNYYPESLGLCLIVDAPWLFQGVWKIIKAWLDPVVQAKVVFVKHTQLDTWLNPEDVPQCLQGKDPYIFEYTPPPPPTSSSSSSSSSSSIAESSLQINEYVQTYLNHCLSFTTITQTWAQLWLKHHSSSSPASSSSSSSFSSFLLSSSTKNTPPSNVDSPQIEIFPGTFVSVASLPACSHTDNDKQKEDEEEETLVDQRNRIVRDLMRPSFLTLDRYFRMPSYWHRMGVLEKGNEGKADWTALSKQKQ